MESLKIDRTGETPLVYLDKEKNIFEISGNSYPEDSTAFYSPLIKWIIEYSNNPNKITEFTFSFIYFNSSSFKSIYDIVHLLETITNKNGFEVKVNWTYKEGDIDIREIGEELAETSKIPFSISPV